MLKKNVDRYEKKRTSAEAAMAELLQMRQRQQERSEGLDDA